MKCAACRQPFKRSGRKAEAMGSGLCHACVDAGATQLPIDTEPERRWRTWYRGFWWTVSPTADGVEFRTGLEIVSLARTDHTAHGQGRTIRERVPFCATGRWEQETL